MSSASLDSLQGEPGTTAHLNEESNMSPTSNQSPTLSSATAPATATATGATAAAKGSARTPTSWDPEDDVLLMHLKDKQKLGWKEIASNFTNRTPNACQFRWRRLKSGNLKNPPKSAAALGDQFKQNPNMASSSSASKKKKMATQAPPPKTETTDDDFQFDSLSTGGFQGFDNNISNALAGLNALSNSPSYISSPSATTPRISVSSPRINYGGPSGRANSVSSLSHKYEASPASDTSETASRPTIVVPGTSGSGGYYADVSVDPTMNLPHNRSHPETPSSITPRNSLSHSTSDHHPKERESRERHSVSNGSVSAAAAALRNNSIIQISNDDRASISSITRASISSLPSKSMNIPHHQMGSSTLAHLPVLFGGAGSISGPSRNSSISGMSGHQTTVSSLRNGSLVSANAGYYSRSGSVVIPHNSEKPEEPLKINKEKIEASNRKLHKFRRNLPPSKSLQKKKQQSSKLDLPWTMEEDELLINRRNRELSFAELSILLPQRTEGEIWARIDYLEKLRNGNDRNVTIKDQRKLRQASFGLDDLYDDDDDMIGNIGVVSDDDDEDAFLVVDDDQGSGTRSKKRRAKPLVCEKTHS
ncbi:uncharacterized protein LODBEIA_P08920 [Lodderomyces beijingensis]|uniref:Myb-like domain-containing protein n=1 Tax=Lodderomyces beijingensis TaxID=1775926 RepID=A0ABP0ZET5_9ASCO